MAIATGPRSVLQCLILSLVVLALISLHAVVNETLGLPDQEPDQEPDSIAFLQPPHSRIKYKLQQRPQLEIVKARGRLQINKDALTEGPLLHPGKENFDSIGAYFPLESSSPLQRYIVGWKPVVQHHECPDGTPIQLVHHINILSTNLSYTKKMQEKTKGKRPFSHWGEDAGLHIVASYDRGAAEYHLPDGYGIPFDQLVLEYHLLMPECWDYSSQPVETSGIDLYVTSEEPAHLAGIFGFTDEEIDIKLGNDMVDHVTVLKPESLAKVFSQDALVRPSERSSRLQLLAVHLHTHDISLSKSLEVLKEDGSVLFQSREEKTGYGSQQSFLSPHEKGWSLSEIQPGHSFRIHCKFDTSKLHHRVFHGTSNGEEMCSALFILGGPAAAFKPPLLTETVLSVSQGFNKLLGPALRSAVTSVKDDIQRLGRSAVTSVKDDIQRLGR